MVISHKMIEKEIDYRGSKSEFSVKEQRVDGSWDLNLAKIHIIFTLLFIFFTGLLFFFTDLFIILYENSFIMSCFVPVMVYHNAETARSKILLDNKGKIGVYLWTHIQSGRIYVGSAINLSNRLSQYYSSFDLKQADNYISRALIHHTHKAFSLSILDYIDIIGLSKEEARELILSREQYYLDLIFSLDESNTYNILKIAGSSLGYLHTEETKTLMSKVFSGENNPMFGKTFTHSAVTKAKISTAKGTAIYVYDSNGLLEKSFTSANKAALYFLVSKDTILKYARNGIIFKEKWILSTSLIVNK